MPGVVVNKFGAFCGEPGRRRYSFIVSEDSKTGDAPAPLRVLIVDDNEAAGQTTGWMVEMMGFDYSLAVSPEAAMATAEDYRPHIVMLDIGLPGMNGFDLCRVMRALPSLSSTVFIAQTGWGQDHHRQRALDVGFRHYHVKPVDYEDLQATLKGIERAFQD